jgi:hypothetical protein
VGYKKGDFKAKEKYSTCVEKLKKYFTENTE